MENEEKIVSTIEGEKPSETETNNPSEVSTEVAIPKEKRCHNCQALLLEGSDFCPDCGRKIEENGSVTGIAQYNQAIENNQLKKGKNKIIAIVIGIVLVIAIAVGGYFAHISQIRQQVLEYAGLLTKYADTIEHTQTDIYYVNEAWEIVNDGSWLYYSTLKSYARTQFQDTIDNAKEANKEILGMYREINAFEIDDPYFKELESEFRNVYDKYTVLYNDVIIDEEECSSSRLDELSNAVTELQDVISDVRKAYAR